MIDQQDCKNFLGGICTAGYVSCVKCVDKPKEASKKPQKRNRIDQAAYRARKDAEEFQGCVYEMIEHILVGASSDLCDSVLPTDTLAERVVSFAVAIVNEVNRQCPIKK